MKTNKTSQKSTSKLQSHPEHGGLAEQPKQASDSSSNSSTDSTGSTSTGVNTGAGAGNSSINHQWRGIFFRGPESVQNRDGDEIPVWYVYVGDDQGDAVGRVYRSYSYDKAETLAGKMSFDRNLELITEANPA